MFQAGVQRKLVKETTGHWSDAVDNYQIMSSLQRKAMNNIIANKTATEVREVRHAAEVLDEKFMEKVVNSTLD